MSSNAKLAIFTITAAAASIIGFWFSDYRAGIAYLTITGGLFLNWLVRFVNGGHMPIDVGPDNAEWVSKSDRHTAMTEHSRLRWLGDIFPIRGWSASVGDIVLTVGLVVLACWALFPTK